MLRIILAFCPGARSSAAIIRQINQENWTWT